MAEPNEDRNEATAFALFLLGIEAWLYRQHLRIARLLNAALNEADRALAAELRAILDDIRAGRVTRLEGRVRLASATRAAEARQRAYLPRLRQTLEQEVEAALMAAGARVLARLPADAGEIGLNLGGAAPLASRFPLDVWLDRAVSRKFLSIRRQIQAGLRRGLPTGEILAPILARSTGPVAALRANLATLVRTTINERMNQMLVNLFVSRGLRRYVWVSVLDDRTTAICRSRNRRVYVVGQGPLPPAHFNCRSIVAPLFADGSTVDFGAFEDAELAA